MKNSEYIYLEIERIRTQINHHDYLYYVVAEPEISDYEYDELMKKLEQLESAYPEFQSVDSPTQRVSGTPISDFANVKHEVPMLSISNCYSSDELLSFHQRIARHFPDKLEYVCELKIDGVAVSLLYENWKLTIGSTRGNGLIGDDITQNLRTIKSIPLSVPDFLPAKFEVRGEIYMLKSEFNEMNNKRSKVGLKTLMNPRNATAGALKLLDPRETSDRPLRFFAYSFVTTTPIFDTHYQSLARLKNAKFPVNPEFQLVEDISGAISYWEKWDSQGREMDYDIDGVVVKLNSYELQNRLGSTSKSPRWVIAFKFSPINMETTIKDVQWQVGRTGALTPVADLEPILLQGTIVKRATLHNYDEIERLSVKVGDVIELTKGGEIIPKIVRVIEHRGEKEIPLPENCPVCHADLFKKEGEVVVRCANFDCPAQVKGRIIHYASKNAMDIEGLGGKTVDLLVDMELVKDVGDLYFLEKQRIEELPRQAELSAENLFASLERSKEKPFDRVIFGLGIRHVGSNTARIIAQSFNDFEALKNAKEEELLEIPEIGPTTAESLVNYFGDEYNIGELLRKLKSAGISGEEISKTEYKLILKGKTFVLTGSLDKFNRESAADEIRKRGGRVTTSVSNKTSFLLAGKNPGSKLTKAQKSGVEILSEEEFMILLK